MKIATCGCPACAILQNQNGYVSNTWMSSFVFSDILANWELIETFSRMFLLVVSAICLLDTFLNSAATVFTLRTISFFNLQQSALIFAWRKRGSFKKTVSCFCWWKNAQRGWSNGETRNVSFKNTKKTNHNCVFWSEYSKTVTAQV